MNNAAESDGWFAKFKVRALPSYIRIDNASFPPVPCPCPPLSPLSIPFVSHPQISDKAEFEALMDEAAYKKHTEKA